MPQQARDPKPKTPVEFNKAPGFVPDVRTREIQWQRPRGAFLLGGEPNMEQQMKETFYRKIGHRYKPVLEYDSNMLDAFPAGAHLVVCEPGCSATKSTWVWKTALPF